MSPFWYGGVICLCEAVVSGIFLLKLLKPKYNVYLTLALWCKITLLISFLTYEVPIIRPFVFTLAELVFLLAVYKNGRKSKLGKFLLKLGLMGASLTASLVITGQRTVILEWAAGGNYTVWLLYLLILSMGTSVVYQILKKNRGAAHLWIIGVQLVLGVAECMAISLLNPDDTLFVFIAVIFMIVANLSTGAVMNSLPKRGKNPQQFAIEKEITRMEYRHYEMSVENEKKLRKIKHDISNQIQTAGLLYRSGEEKKSVEMIGQLKDEYSNVAQIFYCKNPVINVVLSNKRHEAETMGIGMNIHIKDAADDVLVSDYDLSAVLCNLLDNALEGCANCKKVKPKLEIEILQKNRYLVIRVLNSCVQSLAMEETRHIETTKMDGQNHGFGMSIIAEIAEKYHGDFVVSARNGIFTATVALPIK